MHSWLREKKMKIGLAVRLCTHSHGPDGVSTDGLCEGLEDWGDTAEVEDKQYSRLEVACQQAWAKEERQRIK